MSEIKPGSVLGGRYSLSRRLTSGGPGPQRWAASDGTLKRDVTVVTFPTGAPTTGPALDAARQVASTVDQRLARVLDVGEQGDLAFIVVESLEHAQTLTKAAEGGHLHPEEARRVIGEAASALESARLRGLHHQVLNPGHLRVAKDGSVSVSGVATAAALAGREASSAAEASRIDTQRLVACLYAALTGTWPLGGQSVPGLPAAPRHQDGSLKMPAEIVPNVPHDLDDLCHAVLADRDGSGRSETVQTPGDVARSIAPWSADPITPDVAHLNHVAAPMLGAAPGAGPDDPWGDDWDEDAAWDDAFESGQGAYRDPVPGRQSLAGDDYADEYAEPEYDERPLAPASAPQRSRTDTRVTMAIVVGFVILAMALAGLGLATLRNHPWAAASSSTTASRSTTAATTTGAGKPQTAAKTSTAPATSSTSGAAIKPAGATLLTPGVAGGIGSPSDLLDGNAETYWASKAYMHADRSHDPIGLAIDLGSEQQVSSVDVTFAGGTYSPNVYVGSAAGISGATKIGSGSSVSGTWTAKASTPAKGRYVILWFTEAGTPTRNVARAPYGVQVAEVKVHG